MKRREPTLDPRERLPGERLPVSRPKLPQRMLWSLPQWMMWILILLLTGCGFAIGVLLRGLYE